MGGFGGDWRRGHPKKGLLVWADEGSTIAVHAFSKMCGINGATWRKVPGSVMAGAPRNDAAMVYDAHRNQMVLFGGEDPSGECNTTSDDDGLGTCDETWLFQMNAENGRRMDEDQLRDECSGRTRLSVGPNQTQNDL